MKRFIFFLFICWSISSCSKSNSGSVNTPPANGPQVGTKWTYVLEKFDGSGNLNSTTNVVYTAVSEQTIGSDKWLAVTDPGGSTVFLLSKKADGLYQYTGAAGALICKDPASVNDTYTSKIDGKDEIFTVISKDTTIHVPYGDQKVYNYRGDVDGQTQDLIWYKSSAWFVKKEVWIYNSSTSTSHINSRLSLMNLVF
ncbi:MAG: hypothetical protein C5B52_17765 [Bacteroidetes bacterium]|nr:MAG: hypothetical protein C5B52_17765 [Bacteroidota bacterium]